MLFEELSMIPGTFFFMAGMVLGFVWGWTNGREYPHGPQGRV